MPEPTAAPSLSSLFGSGDPNAIAPLPTPPVTDPVVTDPPAPPVADPNNPNPPAPAPDAPPADPNAPPADPNADPNTPDGEEGDEEETAEDFFGKVDALSGVETYKNIDYGDVDPFTPEGMHIREQYIAKQAALTFESRIRENDPRAYAYLLHRQNGGSDDEFFATKSFVLPTLDDVKDNVDLQRTVYSEALRAKGNSEEEVVELLKIATDKGTLPAKAEASWKEISTRDKKMADDAAALSAQMTQRQKDDIKAFDTTLQNVIAKGEELKFQIPEADKAAFVAAFKENLYYENGQMFLMKPVTRDALPKLLETELFAHLGGNLDKLIQKRATTVAGNRFINKNKATQRPINGAGGTPAATGKTLGEL